MRQLRVWAGDPSLRDLADRAGVGQLPKSSLGDVLRRGVLPELGLLHAFVQACGGELHWTHWFEAWFRLSGSTMSPAAPCHRRHRA